MRSSLEIAQEAELLPVGELAEQVGLEPEEVEPYGRYKAQGRVVGAGAACGSAGWQGCVCDGDDADEGGGG